MNTRAYHFKRNQASSRKEHRILKILLVLFIFLSACSPLSTATPPPTPRIILFTRPPALVGWDRKIYSCAKRFPQLAIFVEEKAPESSKTNLPYIFLHLGAPPGESENNYIIGKDEILLLANASFPLDEISLSQLQNAFSGAYPTLQSLDPSASPEPLQAWTYPTGDETRHIFDQSVMTGVNAQEIALIAPDPIAMLEALSSEAGTIGYLPASALLLASNQQNKQLKTLTLKDKPAEFLRQPVIASLSSKPDDLMNAYFQCLQALD